MAIGTSRARLAGSALFAALFVIVTVLNDTSLIAKGMTPASSVFLASWFTLTGVHAAHVLGGAIAAAWFAGPACSIAAREPQRWRSRVESLRRYWLFVDLIWLAIVIGFWV